jgi:hypothetical protein
MNNNKYKFCLKQVELMIKRSKTKIIFPIITYGLIKEYNKTGQSIYTDLEIKNIYEKSVNYFKTYLGHDFHIGGKYYDAYPSRNLPKYSVLTSLENKVYKLGKAYINNSKELENIIPILINKYIEEKLGEIPQFYNPEYRLEKSKDKKAFINLINKQIMINAINFEIFLFAILKMHLERFSCKVYRDTRTSAHDKGVDLSTNFGVIYQIKKLKLINEKVAKDVYNEIKINFSDDRIRDGNVVLIIDDISKDVKSFLINMRIQTISKPDLLELSKLLDLEDRMKVLHVVYEEFKREYKSVI